MSSPERLPTPGEAIKSQLQLKGWTQKDLARILGVNAPLVSDLISGKRPLSLEIAYDLAAAFRTDVGYWLSLETAFRLPTATNPDNNVARRARLFEAAPVQDLIKRRWIQDSSDIELLEKQVLGFYGVDSLDEIVTPPHAAKKSSSYAETSPSERAWMHKVRLVGKMVSVRTFSESSVDCVVAEFKKIMLHPESIRLVPKILADAGIRFVVVEALPRTHIDGVCVWLDKSSPVVALSLRMNQLDSFWFSLLHELGHVKRRDGLLGPVIVDSDLTGENSTPSDQKPEAEKEADLFASATLVDPEQMEDFIARISPLYSRPRIVGFASRMGIHPAIVVGQLQHKREIDWSQYRDVLEKVRDIMTQEALTDGWGQILPAVC
jgi:HTH-type transcriptional regulator/antitoxin HigA